MKKIKIENSSELLVIDFHKLQDLQGDLKTISDEALEKLKQSIIKHNFFVPAFIWFDNEVPYIVDAHQRIKALQSLENDGYEIPSIPYIEIKAIDKKDALNKLLQINSRYGEFNLETTFFEDNELDFEQVKLEVEISELDYLFNNDFKSESDKIYEKEINEKNINIKNKCPKCGYEW